MLFAQQQLYLIKVLMKSQFQQSKQSKQPKKAAQILLQLTPSAIASMSLETINRRLGLQDLLNKEEQQKCQSILATLQAQKGRLQNQQKKPHTKALKENQMLKNRIENMKYQRKNLYADLRKANKELKKATNQRNQAINNYYQIKTACILSNDNRNQAIGDFNNTFFDRRNAQINRDKANQMTNQANNARTQSINNKNIYDSCFKCFFLRISRGIDFFQVFIFVIISLLTNGLSINEGDGKIKLLLFFGGLGISIIVVFKKWQKLRESQTFQHRNHSV